MKKKHTSEARDTSVLSPCPSPAIPVASIRGRSRNVVVVVVASNRRVVLVTCQCVVLYDVTCK